jgi:hypothetical protein
VSAVTGLTVQKLKFVEDVRLEDGLPKNDSYFINPIDGVSLTKCVLQCVTHLPNFSAILFNGGQGICMTSKSHKSLGLVGGQSGNQGWKLFINAKGKAFD